MTLGEQIQALRKSGGLSQEELGEKLGVARQSVSKWESGVTVPELDKLIAMSQIFGVSVGSLLGVEESEGPDHELTQRELEALEAIAQRLTPPQPEGKGRKRWPLAVAALVVLVVGVFLAGRINSLERQLNSLHYNISNIDNSVTRQINSITGQVQEILEQQNAVTAGKGYQVLEMDPAKGTATFVLTATPKEYQEGMTAVFSAAGPDFEGVEVPGELGAGQSFTAQLTCPLADDITLSVAFVKDGVTLNQQLGNEWGLFSETEVYFNGHLNWSMSRTTGGTGGEYTLIYLKAGLQSLQPGQYKTESGWQDLTPVKGSLRLWKNDTLFWSEEREEIGQGRKIEDLSIPTESLELVPGDRLILSILYTDTAGQEKEACLDVCVMEEDGLHMDHMDINSPEWELELPF